VNIAGFTFEIIGQKLKGDFILAGFNAGEECVLHTTDDQKVVRIGANKVELFLGDDGSTPDNLADDVGVRVTGGRALFLITNAGLAGEVSAGATVYFQPGQGVSVAEIKVSINNLVLDGVPQPVNEEFQVGDSTETLSLPAGAVRAVEVNGINIEIGGQTLSGNLAFERVTLLGSDGKIGGTNGAADTTVTRVEASQISLRLGTADRDFVVVSHRHGFLQIIGNTRREERRIFGTISATVQITVPGLPSAERSACSLTRPARSRPSRWKWRMSISNRGLLS
jgi:hypothetical protein